MNLVIPFLLSFFPLYATASLGAVAIALLVTTKRFQVIHSPILLCLAAWLAVALFGAYHSDYSGTAFWSSWERGEGILTIVMVLLAARGAHDLDLETAALMCCAAALACFAFKLGYPPVALGALACVALTATVGRPWYWSIVPGYLLIVSAQRSAIVAAIAGCALSFLMRGKLTLRTVAICCGFGLLCLVSTDLRHKIMHTEVSFEGARTHWAKEGLFLASRIPIWGVGVDTLGNYLTLPANSSYQHKGVVCDATHNFLLDQLLTTGILGFGCILAIMAYTARTSYENLSNPKVAAALPVLVTWATYGLMNPQGVPSTFLALLALFSLASTSNKEIECA